MFVTTDFLFSLVMIFVTAPVALLTCVPILLQSSIPVILTYGAINMGIFNTLLNPQFRKYIFWDIRIMITIFLVLLTTPLYLIGVVMGTAFLPFYCWFFLLTRYTSIFNANDAPDEDASIFDIFGEVRDVTGNILAIVVRFLLGFNYYPYEKVTVSDPPVDGEVDVDADGIVDIPWFSTSFILGIRPGNEQEGEDVDYINSMEGVNLDGSKFNQLDKFLGDLVLSTFGYSQLNTFNLLSFVASNYLAQVSKFIFSVIIGVLSIPFYLISAVIASVLFFPSLIFRIVKETVEWFREDFNLFIMIVGIVGSPIFLTLIPAAALIVYVLGVLFFVVIIPIWATNTAMFEEWNLYTLPLRVFYRNSNWILSTTSSILESILDMGEIALFDTLDDYLYLVAYGEQKIEITGAKVFTLQRVKDTFDSIKNRITHTD